MSFCPLARLGWFPTDQPEKPSTPVEERFRPLSRHGWFPTEK